MLPLNAGGGTGGCVLLHRFRLSVDGRVEVQSELTRNGRFSKPPERGSRSDKNETSERRFLWPGCYARPYAGSAAHVCAKLNRLELEARPGDSVSGTAAIGRNAHSIGVGRAHQWRERLVILFTQEGAGVTWPSVSVPHRVAFGHALFVVGPHLWPYSRQPGGRLPRRESHRPTPDSARIARPTAP
jgi:hypothetical protein